MDQIIELTVDPGDANMRIDAYLCAHTEISYICLAISISSGMQTEGLLARDSAMLPSFPTSGN